MSEEATNEVVTSKPVMLAYHVKDREEDGASFWTRIGAVWAHKDGKGFDVDLELVPTKSGRIVLRSS